MAEATGEQGGSAQSEASAAERHSRPTEDQMEQRRAAVLAMFSPDTPSITTKQIEEKLNLPSSKSVTLITRMLELGLLIEVGKDGRARLFGPGDGKPVEASPTPTRRKVVTSDILSKLQLGGTVTVVALDLDDKTAKIRTPDGQTVVLSAA